MDHDDVEELVNAARLVVERWEKGDLAEAVRELDSCARALRANQALQAPVVSREPRQDQGPETADAALMERTRKLYEIEGQIEIDECPPVSRAEGNPDQGCYVQAWVWVPDEETEPDAETPDGNPADYGDS